MQLYNSVDKQDNYAEFIVENAYKNEIQAFFDEIAGKSRQEYNVADDKYVLALIDDIEKKTEKVRG